MLDFYLSLFIITLYILLYGFLLLLGREVSFINDVVITDIENIKDEDLKLKKSKINDLHKSFVKRNLLLGERIPLIFFLISLFIIPFSQNIIIITISSMLIYLIIKYFQIKKNVKNSYIEDEFKEYFTEKNIIGTEIFFPIIIVFFFADILITLTFSNIQLEKVKIKDVLELTNNEYGYINNKLNEDKFSFLKNKDKIHTDINECQYKFICSINDIEDKFVTYYYEPLKEDYMICMKKIDNDMDKQLKEYTDKKDKKEFIKLLNSAECKK